MHRNQGCAFHKALYHHKHVFIIYSYILPCAIIIKCSQLICVKEILLVLSSSRNANHTKYAMDDIHITSLALIK